jgi:hypothetical protein
MKTTYLIQRYLPFLDFLLRIAAGEMSDAMCTRLYFNFSLGLMPHINPQLCVILNNVSNGEQSCFCLLIICDVVHSAIGYWSYVIRK